MGTHVRSAAHQHYTMYPMKTEGLIGRIGHGHRGGPDWVSRDYAYVDCQAVGCMFNVGKKCAVPSKCKIADDGHCEGFQPKPTPNKLDGD
jgi:hypothetical protein